jgi:hypothetical protein
MAVAAGANLIGGFMQADATTSAAETMAGASRDASANTMAMFQQGRKDVAPWRTAGVNALGEQMRLMGLAGPEGVPTGGTGLPGGYMAQPFTMDKLWQDPSYQWRLGQGLDAVTNRASVGGGVAGTGDSPFGGNVLKALTDYSQGAASQEYGSAFERWNTTLQNLFNRLNVVSGTGANVSGGTAGLGVDASRIAGGFSTDAATALGAGKIGSTNAMVGAGTNIANNYLLAKMIQQMRNPQPPPWNPYQDFSGGGAGQPDFSAGYYGNVPQMPTVAWPPTSQFWPPSV